MFGAWLVLHRLVLDRSVILAGPCGGQILADLGADVTKVERLEGGDDTRGWGPPFLPGADGGRGDAGYFLACNRGKRSIRADLATPEGAGLGTALAARAGQIGRAAGRERGGQAVEMSGGAV